MRLAPVLALSLACAGASADPVSPSDGVDAGAVDEPVCHQRVIRTAPCSGAEFSPEEMEARMRDVTLCDRCLNDEDCDARPDGRCRMVQGDTCQHALRLCLYPDESCYERQACEQTCTEEGGCSRCFHRNEEVVCAQPSPPPP